MQLAQYAKAYQAVSVNTSSPGQLVLMLFDGALRFLSGALQGFEQEQLGTRYEQINNNLLKGQRVLRELQRSLDLDAGGEFARRMFALYNFMVDQLIAANLTKKPEPIHLVEKLLGEIRDAWSQMLQQMDTAAA